LLLKSDTSGTTFTLLVPAAPMPHMSPSETDVR
jgi:hypothetical protein